MFCTHLKNKEHIIFLRPMGSWRGLEIPNTYPKPKVYTPRLHTFYLVGMAFIIITLLISS